MLRHAVSLVLFITIKAERDADSDFLAHDADANIDADADADTASDSENSTERLVSSVTSKGSTLRNKPRMTAEINPLAYRINETANEESANGQSPNEGLFEAYQDPRIVDIMKRLQKDGKQQVQPLSLDQNGAEGNSRPVHGSLPPREKWTEVPGNVYFDRPPVLKRKVHNDGPRHQPQVAMVEESEKKRPAYQEAATEARNQRLIDTDPIGADKAYMTADRDNEPGTPNNEDVEQTRFSPPTQEDSTTNSHEVIAAKKEARYATHHKEHKSHRKHAQPLASSVAPDELEQNAQEVPTKPASQEGRQPEGKYDSNVENPTEDTAKQAEMHEETPELTGKEEDAAQTPKQEHVKLAAHSSTPTKSSASGCECKQAPMKNTANRKAPNFGSIDTKGDGFIDGFEFQQAVNKGTIKSVQHHMVPVENTAKCVHHCKKENAKVKADKPTFGSVDTDGDGIIDGLEFQKAVSEGKIH